MACRQHSSHIYGCVLGVLFRAAGCVQDDTAPHFCPAPHVRSRHVVYDGHGLVSCIATHFICHGSCSLTQCWGLVLYNNVFFCAQHTRCGHHRLLGWRHVLSAVHSLSGCVAQLSLWHMWPVQYMQRIFDVTSTNVKTVPHLYLLVAWRIISSGRRDLHCMLVTRPRPHPHAQKLSLKCALQLLDKARVSIATLAATHP